MHQQNYSSQQLQPNLLQQVGDNVAQSSSILLSNLHQQQISATTESGPINSRRELAYKPSIPQGWNAPRVVLPRGKII